MVLDTAVDCGMDNEYRSRVRVVTDRARLEQACKTLI